MRVNSSLMAEQSTCAETETDAALQESGVGKIEKKNKSCFRIQIKFLSDFPSFACVKGLSVNAFPKKGSN